MKKATILLIIGLLFAFVLMGCNGFIPGEGEGEGEGEPELDKKTVLVEAYITADCTGCQKVAPILGELAQEYSRDRMVLVELAPGGTYGIVEAKQRLGWYGLDLLVPQMTFNGLNDTILGPTSKTVIKKRIDAQLAQTPTIRLEAARTPSGAGTIIKGTVKNISNTLLINLVVNGMVFINRGRTGFHYSVTDIFDDEKVSINRLAPDEEKDFTINIPGLDWTTKYDGVIFVQETTSGKKTIHQSLFLD